MYDYDALDRLATAARLQNTVFSVLQFYLAISSKLGPSAELRAPNCQTQKHQLFLGSVA